MNKIDTAPVIADITQFDKASGTIVERILFNNRPVIMLLCGLLTLFLGFEATKVKLSANYTQMIPVHQPFIINYLAHYDDLQTQSNAIQIAVIADSGTILNAHYLAVLQKLNDEIYLLPGINQPFMQSLWSAQTTWTQITPDGLAGGRVIDQSYDGSPAAVQTVATHIQNAGIIGQIVGLDYKSSMIYAPLLIKEDGKAIGLWLAGPPTHPDTEAIQPARGDD